MAIAVVDWEMFMLIFSFILVLALAIEKESGPFYIFAGIAGTFLAVRTLTLINSAEIAGVIIGVSALMIVYGIRAFSRGEVQ